MCTKRDFKELAHVIMEFGKFKICRIGWQEELVLQVKCRGWILVEFPLSSGRVTFVLCRVSTDCMKPTRYGREIYFTESPLI